jgi:hypothetical protein
MTHLLFSRTVNGSLFWLLICYWWRRHMTGRPTTLKRSSIGADVAAVSERREDSAEAWLKVTSNVDLPADLVERFRRASKNLASSLSPRTGVPTR